MNEREGAIAGFLAAAGWAKATRTPLAGDASARRYERLTSRGLRAVLMDAPPERGEDTGRFARVDRWLRAQGYSAPEILSEDHRQGFLLLEDLGDAVVARVLEREPAKERDIYEATTDFLADLHGRPIPGFASALDGRALGDLIRLALEWYAPGVGAAPEADAETLPRLIESLHDRLADGGPVLSLRDFHSENLIWLPERSGHARIGLLDFQDAVAAHPAYDLVSLLQDARRDVAEATEAAMLARYAAARDVDPVRFAAIYALIGAQRALRIIGVFARLARRDGRTQYLRFLPRVWSALDRNLAHPALGELAAAVAAQLPAPTPERMAQLAEGPR